MSGFVETRNRTFEAGAAITQFARVKLSAGKLAVADATDNDLGVADRPAFADGDDIAVTMRNAQGTIKMIAGGAITLHANVYGAAAGKVDDVVNENFIGIALTSASGANSIIEVLPLALADSLNALGAIDGNVIIDEDFVGDWPAAGTALSGQGAYAWTKTETNGLGVTSVDAAAGVVKLAADAVAEAATAALYFANSPIDPAKGGFAEFIVGIFDIGDDAAVDFDFGLASDTAATDFGAIAEFVSFHLDGADLSLTIQTDDGTTDTAPVDTTVDLVDDTFYAFKIDFTDLTGVKFYYRALGAAQWTRLASATTFDVSQASAKWTPIALVEKTSNDSTFDMRLDRVRVQGIR